MIRKHLDGRDQPPISLGSRLFYIASMKHSHASGSGQLKALVHWVQLAELAMVEIEG
jgi:hypothetical protein